MGKKKKEKAQSINNTQGLKVEIDYDKLAEAIVKAKQIEKQNEEQEKAKKLAEWRATIGYKEHDDKKGLRRTLFRLCNRIKVIFKIMFILRKKRPGGKFCVSVFRQNQEYHIINVHDGAYSPWLHPSRKVGAVCAPRAV